MAIFRYKVKDSVAEDSVNVRGIQMFKTWWYTGKQTQPVHAFAEARDLLDGEVALTKEDLEGGKGVVFDISTIPDLNDLASVVAPVEVSAPKVSKKAKAETPVEPAPEPVVAPTPDEPVAPVVAEELP